MVLISYGNTLYLVSLPLKLHYLLLSQSAFNFTSLLLQVVTAAIHYMT